MIPYLASALDPIDLSVGLTSGNALDFNGKGTYCLGIQSVGTVESDGFTLDGKFEESTDNISWTAVSGGGFVQVSETGLPPQTIYFKRTKRYIRWAGTLAGDGIVTCLLGVIVGNNPLTPITGTGMIQ